MAADDDETIDRADASCRILCLTGPESSGKSTLAAALAERFSGRLVPEVAREYLAGRGRDQNRYGAEDVLEIARLQVAAEVRALTETAGLVVCDTDLLVIRVWWEERFGDLPGEMIELLAARSERAYLLMRPDLPWEQDPLRENPVDRERLFAAYQALLETDTMPHRIVSGIGETRLQAAVEASRSLLPERLSAE